MIPPAPFLLLRITMVIHGFLWFHMNMCPSYNAFFFRSLKYDIGILGSSRIREHPGLGLLSQCVGREPCASFFGSSETREHTEELDVLPQ